MELVSLIKGRGNMALLDSQLRDRTVEVPELYQDYACWTLEFDFQNKASFPLYMDRKWICENNKGMNM